jgi:hypothetical protein
MGACARAGRCSATLAGNQATANTDLTLMTESNANGLRRVLALAAASLMVTACGAGPGERYGFVTVLGRDTVAVERITRSTTRLVSDEVDRWPAVRERHTEIDLAADGSITHRVMDVRTPNAPSPRERGRRVTADVTQDSVRISIRDSSGVKDTAFVTGGAITVPHVSMMYSVIELEIAAAIARGTAAHIAAGDSVPFRQWYPDRDIGESFVLHSGFVQPQANGRVQLWHDWLSGVGFATVDTSRRMLAYSGAQSTYKVDVKRVTRLPDVDAMSAKMTATERSTGGIKQLSVRDTARATIGGAAFSVDYGRPLLRGRVLLGDVIQYDEVWRMGANAATQFTTSRAITLDGLTLAPGTYTLWAAPHQNGVVDLIVNKEHGQWGTDYDASHDAGSAPLHTETVNAPTEKFTISITSADAHHGSLVIEWGTFRWTAPIDVDHCGALGPGARC